MHKISNLGHNRCANKIVSEGRGVSVQRAQIKHPIQLCQMDSEVWLTSCALQPKPTVNFKMLLHPMQRDSRGAENNVRVDRRKLRARGSVSVLGKILASVKSMAMLPLPSAALGFHPLPIENQQICNHRNIHYTGLHCAEVLGLNSENNFNWAFVWLIEVN